MDTIIQLLVAAVVFLAATCGTGFKLFYNRLVKAEETIEALRLKYEELKALNGEAEAKVEMYENCPKRHECPFHRPAICAMAIVALCCLTSCMALVDVERPGGVRYSAAVAVGTDATEISREGSWKATGVNNSTAAGSLKSGVITREGLRLAAPAVSSLGGSVGRTLEAAVSN